MKVEKKEVFEEVICDIEGFIYAEKYAIDYAKDLNYAEDSICVQKCKAKLEAYEELRDYFLRNYLNGGKK